MVNQIDILQESSAWRAIPSRPSYEASYTGLIRHRTTKRLKFPVNYGRYLATLSRTVQHLVYEAWIGPLKAKQCIMHLNDDGLDNQVGNLKQGSYKTNSRMGINLRRLQQGKRCLAWFEFSSDPVRSASIKEILHAEYCVGKFV